MDFHVHEQVANEANLSSEATNLLRPWMGGGGQLKAYCFHLSAYFFHSNRYNILASNRTKQTKRRKEFHSRN